MARIETRGQNNWNARTGYQYRQRVAGPIEPMVEQKPALVNRAKQVVSALSRFGRG